MSKYSKFINFSVKYNIITIIINETQENNNAILNFFFSL